MYDFREADRTDNGMPWGRGVVLLGLISVLGCSGVSVSQAALPSSCSTAAAATETDGIRRLAMLVGVGKYKNEKIPTLAGPVGDVERMFGLLTGPGGYGYPKENVCVLLDEQATMANFTAAFDQALVKRARKMDVALIYFSGHGSLAPDLNGDEGDGTDETLVLHDSRTNGVHDLLDDEFNAMLEQLHKRTQQITVALDSCNSRTAIRGDVVSLTARYAEPETSIETRLATPQSGKVDGSPSFTPKDLPGLVLLSAAQDGTSAMEVGGHGIFTDALLAVFAQAPKPAMTYVQAFHQVRSLVAARSPQIPDFHGDVSRTVFGNETRSQPMGMRVSAIAEKDLTLNGPPLPGLGMNAEMRVYDGKALGTDTQDPKKAKATIIIKTSTGLSATARMAAKGPRLEDIHVDDLAVLVRPADQFLTRSVRLRPSTQTGGIPVDRASAIRKAIQRDPETKTMVALVEDPKMPADFELSLQENHQVVLRDGLNQIRNVYKSGEDESGVIAQNLWQHARQMALQQLRGEGGQDFKDGETLQVSLDPEAEDKQLPCAKGTTWVQANPNTEQDVPLCYRYRVKVKSMAKVPLLVGGVVLSSDGAIIGFGDMLKEPLQPGQSRVFQKRFRGEVPLNVKDVVMVVGTLTNNPIDWELFKSSVDERAKATRGDAKNGEQTGTLSRALGRYLVPGTRSQVEDAVVEDGTWTRSSITVVVRANSGFLTPTNGNKQVGGLDKREYTIPNFDIRPYLPDDGTTALARVLHVADSLAKYSQSMQDGVGYKQHPWIERTDAENLKKGIDCSRAIWFAFTRAGLPYNRQGNAYVPTVEMAKSTGPMSEEFESCQGKPVELGDILVYRDDKWGDGHTVMAIDPIKRIAWGSHGWDGNVNDGRPSDTGVEYQLIKYKTDWNRWDRSTMAQKACWRYRQMAEDATTGRGVPGLNALRNSCDQQICRLSSLPDESFVKSLQEVRR
ncbi:MAG: caspase family protein [Nitrospira sp.]